MPYEKGRNQYLAIKRETTRGTAETTGFTNGTPWDEFSVVTKMESFKDESADGTVGVTRNAIIMKQWAEGSIKGKLDTDNVLWALANTFGTATPTTALGATTWALSVLNSNLLPTFTIQTKRGDESFRRVRGCAIKKFALDVALDDTTYSVDVIGRAEEAGQVQTPTYTKASRTIIGKSWTLGYSTTLGGLSSPTNIAKVQSASFEFETGVDGQQFLGSVNLDDTPANGRKATLKATITLDNTNSMLTQFEAGTKLAFRLDGNATNLPVIGTSALRPRLYIDIPPSLINIDYKVERDSYIMYDISVEIENPELIVATLINATSAIQ